LDGTILRCKESDITSNLITAIQIQAILNNIFVHILRTRYGEDIGSPQWVLDAYADPRWYPESSSDR
jgi:hypothetical protein